MKTIYFRGTRRDVVGVLRRAVAALTGSGPDVHGMVHDVQMAVGTEAMSLVRQAFLVKSKGGTDEAGDSWDKLNPKYVAYKRRHSGVPMPIGGFRGGVRRWSLTASQDKLWKRIFSSTMNELAAAQPYVGTEEEIKARHAEHASASAAKAWIILKGTGATTLLEDYGGDAEIGRDTDVMFNSLSPGVLRTEPGSVIGGTNIPYAAHFHKRRAIWPDPQRWPARWWNQICGAGVGGVRKLLVNMLEGW